MCFLWSCLWSWACVLMTRHCVDSGGSGLILIFLFQRHGLCVVPFVVHPSVCGHFSWKDSWCERHTHHVRRGKSIANDAALAGRSHVAANAACRSSQRIMNKPFGKLCRPSARFKKMRTQMPTMLFVPRANVVRNCLHMCSEQEQANKTTHDHQ